MASILLSGPAGAAKSQEARRLLQEASEPTIAADFQSIVAALLLQERDEDGKYPPRPDWVLPTAEYVRRTVISAARNRGINVIATNSDGATARRQFLVNQLGPGATERVVDPGMQVVRNRLAGRSGRLSADCGKAIARWYGRLRR